MESKTIYIKEISPTTNNLKIALRVYNPDLPEFTLGSKIIPAVIDETTKSIIAAEYTEEYQTPRPEESRTISVPINYPIGHIEDLIKKELEVVDNNQKDVEEKLEYFRNKVYSNVKQLYNL